MWFSIPWIWQLWQLFYRLQVLPISSEHIAWAILALHKKQLLHDNSSSHDFSSHRNCGWRSTHSNLGWGALHLAEAGHLLSMALLVSNALDPFLQQNHAGLPCGLASLCALFRNQVFHQSFVVGGQDWWLAAPSTGIDFWWLHLERPNGQHPMEGHWHSAHPQTGEKWLVCKWLQCHRQPCEAWTWTLSMATLTLPCW